MITHMRDMLKNTVATRKKPVQRTVGMAILEEYELYRVNEKIDKRARKAARTLHVCIIQ